MGRCARSARTGAFFPTRNRCSSCIIWPWSGLPRSGRCRSSPNSRPSTNLPSNLASGCPGWIEPMNPRVTDHSTAGGASRGLAARPLLVLPRCQRAGSHHHNKNQNKTPLTQITLQNPSRPSSVPFWHTTPFLFHLSISNRYPNRYPNNPFPPLIRPATTCPALHAAAPTAPDHRGTQTHVSAIFRLLASSRRLMASFTIRSRSANRFISSDGCCSTPLFMQPQLLLSIPFPRSEPDCSPRL